MKAKNLNIWLPLSLIAQWETLAKDLDVSNVARSSSGFLPQYKRAKEPQNLTRYWRNKRDNFNTRHMAQVKRLSDLYMDYEKDGVLYTVPSRRHLALIIWAYSPEPTRLMELTRTYHNLSPSLSWQLWDIS